MNLPTDTLYKFIALLGVAIISTSIAQLIVIDEERTDAQISAKAAHVELLGLEKQSKETFLLAIERYKDSNNNFRLAAKLANAGKVDLATEMRASAEERLLQAKELNKQGDDLFNKALKKEIESNRLASISDDVSLNCDSRTKLSLAVLVLGLMFFCWGVYVWARTTKSSFTNIPTH